MSISFQLRSISAEEFDDWPSSRKIIVHDHARRFAAAGPAGALDAFALSWRSDIVEPIVVMGDQSDTWLGIDQRVACISDDGRVVVSLGLVSPVLTILCFRDGAAVVCETAVLVFNSDHSIRVVKGLSDIPSDVIERDGRIIVVFDDEHQESIG